MIKDTLRGMLVASTPPFCTNGFEPFSRVTLYLTAENSSRDMLGAARLTIALWIHVAKLTWHQRFRPQNNSESLARVTPDHLIKSPHNGPPWSNVAYIGCLVL